MKNNKRYYSYWFVALPSLLTISIVQAEKFNMDFVHGNENINTAEQVLHGEMIQPGSYLFDIYLNDQKVDSRQIKYVRNIDRIEPCFTSTQIYEYGILLPEVITSSQCIDIKKIIPESTINSDINLQRLDLTIPQAFLQQQAAGSIPKRIWDNGINAGFINYNLNFNKNNYHNSAYLGKSEYTYLALNNGINIDRWRLRQNGNYTHDSINSSHYYNIASWAETDLSSIRSRLIIGQASTSNNVYDSIQFRGAKLSSVDEMLPESLRNYAPVVRGVASSNARVSIRQNGYLVYSTTVAPGPFAIHDIYPNSSGTLYVTVTEADGREQHFSVAFSSVTNMLREGIWNYEVTAGRYHDGVGGYQPQFIQATLARGLPNNFTPFGGGLIADNYQSAILGVGFSIGEFGALSLDGSYAKTNLASGEDKQGQSYRLLYAKSLNALGTDFRLAGYRYSTSGYYDFSDAIQERRDWMNGNYQHAYLNPSDLRQGIPVWAQDNNALFNSNRYANKRERMELALNQSLDDYGNIYLNANQQRYWGTDKKSRTVQGGYNYTWKSANYGVYWQSTRSQYGYSDHSINFTLAFPLIFNNRSNIIVATAQYAHNNTNGDSYNTGVSGTLLEDNRLSYGLTTGHSSANSQTSAANLGYQYSSGNLNASYSYSNNYTQTALGASGGIVAHSGGITLSQPLGDTFAIIKAKHADGVGVMNNPGVKIDQFGYAIINNITPYRYNTIALNTEQMKPGLDIPQSILQIVPTQKAIVGVNFNTFYGHSLLIHTHNPNYPSPPIGAVVFNDQGRNSGTVGLNGDLYVSGVKAGEMLIAKWGTEREKQCELLIPRTLEGESQSLRYQELTLVCQPCQGAE